MKSQIFLLFATLFVICIGLDLREFPQSRFRKTGDNVNIPIKLVFTTTVPGELRSLTYLILNHTTCPSIYFTNITTAKETNMDSIEYTFPSRSVNCFGVYHVIYVENGTQIDIRKTMYIYQNELELVKPKDRYFLVDDHPKVVHASYKFKENQASEAIQSIRCYNSLNRTEIYQITNFTVNGKDLEVNLVSKTNYTDYYCDIYPLYGEGITLESIHRFKIGFHEYLLRSEAVYFDKANDNQDISFKLEFKEAFFSYKNNDTFVIKDGPEKIIDYHLKDEGCINCEFLISPGRLTYPGAYSIFFKKYQERELFYIIYENTYFEQTRCYNRTSNLLLSINFHWSIDMVYTHNLFFNQTADIEQLKPIEYTTTFIGTSYKTANYSVHTSSMNIGLFSLRSSIPELNYTRYNPVNPDRLYLSIISDISVTSNNNIILYKNSDFPQLINMSFNEPDIVKSLNQITFQETLLNNVTRFPVSKTTKECFSQNSTNYICNLTNTINSMPINNILGTYRIEFSDICQNLANISNLMIQIKLAYNLVSFYPTWFNETKVNGSDLTLIFDLDVNDRNKIEYIMIKNKTNDTVITYQGNDNTNITINNKQITIKLGPLETGIYHVEFKSSYDIFFYRIKPYFKVSNENISFIFSHHYFVLNNDGERKLEIKVINNTGDFGGKLLSSNNDSLIKNDLLDIFEFRFNKIGTIKFSYYDNDNFLIPIPDNITIVNTYSEIFYFSSIQNCYYYKFDITLERIRIDLNFVIFLKNNRDSITLSNSSNRYFNDSAYYSLSDSYTLYVSEGIRDENVYLYKLDNIKFTNISVPEYIMKPNLYFYFNDVTCDLSGHGFNMFKNKTGEQKNIQKCNYISGSKRLLCNISGGLYNNDPFDYYYFRINEREINTTNQKQLTFVSNRLNESDFVLQKDKRGLNYNISIQLKNNDFYFPLIDYLNNSLYSPSSSKTTIITLYNKSYPTLFDFNNKRIMFNIVLSLFDTYIIGNLTRIKGEDEIFDESFYYNFNHIINNTLFTVSPTIFAYNERKEKYEITISYSLREDKESFNQTTNLTCREILYSYERHERICDLNISDTNFKNGSAQNFFISIGNKENKTIQAISFIYYELSKDKNKCTKTKEMSIFIDVHFPEKKFKDILKVSCESCKNVDTIYKNDSYNQYNLTWESDNILESPLYLYINNGMDIQQFNMKQLGLKIYPMYNFILTDNNNENNIYLFATDDQKVKVSFRTSEYFIANMDEIKGFSITNSSKIEFQKEEIDAISLNIKFNVSDKNPGTYDLYYIDNCTNPIKTNLHVVILKYRIDRHYFVINNNNGQSTQRMSLSIDSNNIIEISVYKDNNPSGSMNYTKDSKEYYYNFGQNSEGNYTFEVIHNNGIRSMLKDIVYVREKYDVFLNIIGQPKYCLYYQDIIREINLQISKKEIVKNLSDFSIHWRSNTRTEALNMKNGNNNNKNFTIKINDDIIINQSYHILITENNDASQPIYVLNYTYTNISLSEEYTVLYTDTSFIEFGMACDLPGNLNFNLINSSRILNFKCNEALSFYQNLSNTFRCQLFINDTESLNNLIKNDVKSGEYDLIYGSNGSNIIRKNIFLSYDIKKINFTLDYDEMIMPKQNLTVTLSANPNQFYMPYIYSVRYYEGSNQNEEFDTKINRDTLVLRNPNFTCSIYIKKNMDHYIYKVCRKECRFCIREENCVGIKSIKKIQSTLPEVYFNFDKHYINLANGELAKTINIKVSEDADLIDNIYYNYTKDGKSFKTGVVWGLTKYDYYFPANGVGKYMFMYKAQGYNKNITIQNDMVFVVNNFSDLINFHDDSNRCLYYKKTGDKGILAFMTIQDSYIFKNDVPISYFDLYIDGIRFPYTKDYGYQIVQEYEDAFNYNQEQDKTIYIIENNVNPEKYVFGEIHYKKITSFDVDMPTNESFFYKDNIVLKNIHCDLKNIYIQPITDLNVRHSPLVCEFSPETRQSFCNAISYTFDNHYSDDVELFIGYKSSNISNTIFDIEQSILIYNSIADSDFTTYYKYPNLTIFSNNFLMNLTESIKIDDKILNASFFESVFEKYILINFSKNLTEFNYLSEISRFPHEKDRSETLPPRTKSLNLSIVNCGEYQRFYEGKCHSCLEISLLSGQPLNLWFQDGDCLTACTPPYAVFDSQNHYCKICTEATKIGEIYWCGCLEGTVKLEEDNICYLPESDKIQNAAIRRPNIFCYRTNGDFNYCNNTNNNTERCEVISISGHDFPICHCNNGFYGKYCENSENNTLDLESTNLDPILEERIEDQINANNSNTISKIRGLIYFFETDIEYTYMKNINKTKINTYINAAILSMNNSIDRQSAGFEMYDVIELCIYFLTYNIRNSQQESSQTYQDQLNYILENVHDLNFIANKHKSNFNINSDGLNLISFISYRKDAIDVSFKKYIKQENEKTDIIGYIDLLNNIIPKSEVLVITIINKLLFSYTNQRVGRNLENTDELTTNSDDGIIIKFSSNNNNTELSALKDFNVYIHTSNLNVNYDLANYYQQFNIGIYNLYDECFVEPCYFNRRLDYDLTQKYRKKYLYQKLLLNSEKCSYNSFDVDTDNIEFYCPEFDSFGRNKDGSEYGTLNFTFKLHHIENENKNYKLLPIKCTKKIDDIKDNLAFRIFFVILGIELVYIIVISIFSCNKLRNFSMIAGINNDILSNLSSNALTEDMNSTHSEATNSTHPEDTKSNVNKKGSKKKRNNGNNNEGNKNETKSDNGNQEESELSKGDNKKEGGVKQRNNGEDFFECFWKNIKDLHPIISLVRTSVIQPLILQSWFLTFNALNLFGFNALFYLESLIEERIYKPYRDDFSYPMKKEFGKIILSILCQVIFCFLIKLIVLVPYKEKENLEKYVKRYYKSEEKFYIDNSIVEIANKFEKDHFLKRLIGGLIMLIIVVFFFYYCIVFCGIYIKTQWCWIYSTFWSMLWIYIVFSPLYILIITFLENKKKLEEPKLHYIKRLFVF